MTSRPFELTDLGAGVASLRIASDEAPHVRLEDVGALREVFARAARADGPRALVLVGGERYFCAGATRETLLRPDAADAIHALVGEIARLVVAVPIPTIAAMAGHAIGGGWMFGLWCDAAIHAEQSLYSANFVGLGFTPGMGATVILSEVFGAPLARQLLFTSRTVTGSELRALAPTMSHAIVPRQDVRARAHALADEVASQPASAVRAYKAHVSAERRAVLDRALEHERGMHARIFAEPQTRSTIERGYPHARTER